MRCNVRISRLVLLIISAALLGGLGLPAGAQPPPPAPVVPKVELPGVGTLTMLPDVADGDWVFTGKLTPADPAALKLTVALLYESKTGDHYELRLAGNQAQFFLVRGGKALALGRAGDAGEVLKAGQVAELDIRHEGWSFYLLLAGRLVTSAQDATLQTGGLGYALAGGALDAPVLQFLGQMAFYDDFKRTTEGSGHWQPVTGTWTEQLLRVDPLASTTDEEKSVAAVSYDGKIDKGRGVSVNGYWFWSDYALTASVRPLGGGACGIVAYYRDADNYLALRWTPHASTAPDGNRLQLVERVGGQERVLADTPGGFRAGQWYKLGISLSGGWVHAFLDDEEVLSTRNDVFRQGRIGVLEEGSDGVKFDDVTLIPWGYFADDFSGHERWDAVAGDWNRDNARYTASGPGLLVGPALPWPNYAVSADTHLEKGASGLLFSFTDPKNYWLLRYSQSGGGAVAELVQMQDGEEKVLASAGAPHGPGLAVRLSAEVNNDIVTGRVGDTKLFRVALATAPRCRVGLFSSGAGNWFSFAEAHGIDPPTVAHVTKEMMNDDDHWEMAKWATARSPWEIPAPLLVEKMEGQMILDTALPAAGYGNNMWWTKANYYGDKVVAFKIPSFGIMTGTAKVILDSHPDAAGAPVGGYLLTLSAKAGSKALALSLSAGEKALGQASVNVEDAECKIDYSRAGQYLQVRVNDKLVLEATVSD